MGPSPRTSVGHVEEPFSKRCRAHQHPCRRLRRRLKVTAGLTLCPKLTIRTGRSACLLAVWLAASGLPLTNIATWNHLNSVVMDRLQERRPSPQEIVLGVSRRGSGLAPAWYGLAPTPRARLPSLPPIHPFSLAKKKMPGITAETAAGIGSREHPDPTNAMAQGEAQAARKQLGTMSGTSTGRRSWRWCKSDLLNGRSTCSDGSQSKSSMFQRGQVLKEIVEVARLVPHERVERRVAEHIVAVPRSLIFERHL